MADAAAVTLRQLGVSDVNMEEGSLRCDANISLRPEGTDELGTKTELKNMNSFRYLERGVNAEIERQRAIIEGGGAVEQETLHFDPRTERITSLRSKEEAHDYRYFPEPDLVPIAISEEMLGAARAAMPELPVARAQRLEGLGLGEDSARLLAFRPELGDRFEAAHAAGEDVPAQALANWLVNEDAAAAGSSPRPWRRSWRWSSARRSPATAAAPSSSAWPGTAGTRARSSRRRASARSGRRRAGAGRRGGAGGQPGRRGEAPRGRHEADRRDRRPRHEGDPRPGRRRRGHAPGARAARPVGPADRASSVERGMLDAGPRPARRRRRIMLVMTDRPLATPVVRRYRLVRPLRVPVDTSVRYAYLRRMHD